MFKIWYFIDDVRVILENKVRGISLMSAITVVAGTYIASFLKGWGQTLPKKSWIS